MLINLTDLIQKYNLKIDGILHIGAHECEEVEIYLENGISFENQLWIEAIPEKFEFCKNKYPQINIINAIVSNTDGENITFNITNNYQSSSILKLKTHLVEHPHVQVTSKFEGKTKTMKTIYNENNLIETAYNFINLDIQGAELLALKGMGDILNNFNYIYTEINEKELYENCALIPEMDNFLRDFGFERVEISMTSHGWGDAFYIRNSVPKQINKIILFLCIFLILFGFFFLIIINV